MLLWNTKVHQHVSRSLPLDLIPNQLNLVHTCTSYFSNIHFNNVFPFVPSSRFLTQNIVYISHFLLTISVFYVVSSALGRIQLLGLRTASKQYILFRRMLKITCQFYEQLTSIEMVHTWYCQAPIIYRIVHFDVLTHYPGKVCQDVQVANI